MTDIPAPAPQVKTFTQVKRFRPRPCRSCEAEFTPSGPHGLYCPNCGPAARNARKRALRAPTVPAQPPAADLQAVLVRMARLLHLAADELVRMAEGRL